ncbi:toll/interleukin-1 receptor domain-containing protein [Dyella kyungheensis]|uniref:toll/interleukin-1 receptor domain-containing protein n=1 Tax=Dyella kyungheensis TaxID=1242174 RepID=UPI003CED925F
MAVTKHLYGKVFISHSSVDKPFVRRLAKAIEADGFLTWLDEKELLPGDPLAKRVSEGVAQARAVLVVVSQAAIASKWLAFELNKAADRMVKGECIVIPIVIEDVRSLPAEVEGLLYADFTKSFKRQMEAVLKSLNSDAQKRAIEHSFYSRCEIMLEEVFDGKGFSFTDAEYKSDSESLVYINNGDSDDQAVAYDILSAYGDVPKPFTERGIDELERTMSNSSEPLRLIVSERPVTSAKLTSGEHPKVSIWPVGGTRDPDGYLVFADLSSASERSECISILEAAKAALAEKVEALANRWTSFRKANSAGKQPTLREALGIDANASQKQDSP